MCLVPRTCCLSAAKSDTVSWFHWVYVKYIWNISAGGPGLRYVVFYLFPSGFPLVLGTGWCIQLVNRAAPITQFTLRVGFFNNCHTITQNH